MLGNVLCLQKLLLIVPNSYTQEYVDLSSLCLPQSSFMNTQTHNVRQRALLVSAPGTQDRL